MLSDSQRDFLEVQRVAHLATAGGDGAPHVVPVCYVVRAASAYTAIDEKPKRSGARALRRVRNVQENPRGALVVDRWDEDWHRLGWVMLRGPVEILDAGPEHGAAIIALRERYPQYRAMSLESRPVLALRIERISAWGRLDP
jgi:PPOX class probable F420-dependent enzyme